MAGSGGIFMFGSFNSTNNGVTYWAFNGNNGSKIPYPSSFPAAVPFIVQPTDLPAQPNGLTNLILHNGLARPGVDPVEDDNPQGFGGIGGAGGRTIHQRRHHLTPVNQNLVSWYVVGPPHDVGPRLLVSTVAKPATAPLFTAGGVLTVDYMGYPTTAVPPFASSVWPNSFVALLAGGPSVATFYPAPTGGSQNQVLSDLAPNVYTSANPSAPNGLAWVTGTQASGDFAATSMLVIADYTTGGVPPTPVNTVLGSPFSPYADKILVWNDTGSHTTLPQWVIVPCSNGVEIYDPAPAGPSGTPALMKTILADTGKEICSNVSFFGPSPYEQTPGAYFIVLERDRGETQAGTGVNFIVFDLVSPSTPSRGPASLPGLMNNYPIATALDMVRGFNDIAIAPPKRQANGDWDPAATPGATAWFGVWDAAKALAASPLAQAPPFGAMVGVENRGLSPYNDGGLGLNTLTPGTASVRYFTPVDPAAQTFGAPATGWSPVPVGEVSTNPIFRPYVDLPINNQNLVAWYWDTGNAQNALSGKTGYGVAVLDVLATWVSAGWAAYPGGIQVDGTFGGATGYTTAADRSQETITERPLFGYVNWPLYATIFAQRQAGIETFTGYLNTGVPRPVYSMISFPQTPPPTSTQWLYQKRRHTAWNPPFSIQPTVIANSSTRLDDTVITVEATQTWTSGTPYPGADDWVAYFVDWRWDVVLGVTPWPQNTVPFGDWYSARVGNILGSPFIGLNLGATDATSCPPPTEPSAPGVGNYFYGYNGQTSLWVNWLGVVSGFGYLPVHGTVLRTHTNLFPFIGAPQPNNAWVGIGAEMALKYSLGSNDLQSSPPFAGTFAAGEPSIIACHIDQIGAGAGRPPTPLTGTPGPGTFRVNFLHFQALPAPPIYPLAGYEMTCVNNPAGTDWKYSLPATEVVTTEILSFTAP